MGRVETQVEELAGDKVRVSVDVPVDDMRHAVDHAASDLATSVKIPGFRKGKVPLPVLIARVGKERLYSEAVESHIGGWLRNALADTRVRPVGRAEYEYDLPDSPDETFHFSATLPVQPPVAARRLDAARGAGRRARGARRGRRGRARGLALDRRRAHAGRACSRRE